jgi:hypothetical protein
MVRSEEEEGGAQFIRENENITREMSWLTLAGFRLA